MNTLEEAEVLIASLKTQLANAELHLATEREQLVELRLENRRLRDAMWLAAEEWMYFHVKPGPGPQPGECMIWAESETRLVVNCGDTFAYSCADHEEAQLADTTELRRIAETEGWPGIVRWCQKHGQRGEPIDPVRKSMAHYDDLRREYESLKEKLHTFAAHVRELPGKRPMETAPKDGTEIFLVTDDVVGKGKWAYEWERFGWMIKSGDTTYHVKPTGWFPLIKKNTSKLTREYLAILLRVPLEDVPASVDLIKEPGDFGPQDLAFFVAELSEASSRIKELEEALNEALGAVKVSDARIKALETHQGLYDGLKAIDPKEHGFTEAIVHGNAEEGYRFYFRDFEVARRIQQLEALVSKLQPRFKDID